VAGGALLASGAKLTPADLLNEPLLHLATRPRLWSQWLESAGLPDETAYRGHRFDQFSMIIEAAVAGMGYALLPRYLIEQELKSGELRVVLDLPMETENSYYTVLPEVRTPSSISQHFVSWLMQQIGRGS
jgi:LysR family glycine cleavage system transcriptional activator